MKATIYSLTPTGPFKLGTIEARDGALQLSRGLLPTILDTHVEDAGIPVTPAEPERWLRCFADRENSLANRQTRVDIS